MKRVFAAGMLGLAGFALANRRRLPRERVDIYREDETLETFEAGSPEVDRILALAREILG